VRLFETQRVDLILDLVDEIGGVCGCLRGRNGVPVMEAMSEGDEGR
jgi:hypothetical protein